MTKSAAKASRKRYGYRLIRESDAPTYSNPVRRNARCPQDVAAIMAPFAAQEPAEVFWVVCLDSQHRVPSDGVVAVTRGTLNSSLVHAREVFREAILRNAASVILCHNHPSGETTPSADDRIVTGQLCAAGLTLDIPVHDHMIIAADGRFYSFAEHGLI